MTQMSSAGHEVTDIVATGGLDWTRPQTTAQRAREVLDRLTDRPDLLASLVRDATCSGAPTAASESYPYMDKLVVWQSADAAVRLRLHVFHPGYLDRPHNHRWSFVSRILKGSYLHTLYGTEADVLHEVRQGMEPRPRYVRYEQAGGNYFLEDSMVHSLCAEETTVSLLLRGPAIKERYFTVLPDDGSTPVAQRLEWSGGAASERATERRAKQITESGIERVVRVLTDVLGPESAAVGGA